MRILYVAVLSMSIGDPQMSDKQAYTIPEFCSAHSICRNSYYKLREIGKAPRVMRLGSKVLISKEEATAWRERMTEAHPA